MARWDLLFIALSGAHGLALAAWPTIPVMAIAMWWNANTIAHNFIHRPFFKARSANLVFSAYLSLLLGIPQSLWRQRHLAHHRGVAWRLALSRQFVIEAALVCALWTVTAVTHPMFFATSYLPAYCLGLTLCGLQGHYEHAHGTTSHYGAIYNVLCFNDGYHVEHHANPAVHWTRLRERNSREGRSSLWPPILRWMDDLSLEGLERLVLRFPVLQRLVLRAHRQALAALVPRLTPVRRIAIVGGGLFPRTALLLRDLLPDADIVVVDASAENLGTALSLMGGTGVEFIRGVFSAPGSDFADFDLLVLPLSFKGDRELVYRSPPTRALLVHDWIWHRRGEGRIVSVALLKRLNLVTQ
jgi:hypothetical protein